MPGCLRCLQLDGEELSFPLYIPYESRKEKKSGSTEIKSNSKINYLKSSWQCHYLDTGFPLFPSSTPNTWDLLPHVGGRRQEDEGRRKSSKNMETKVT